MRVNREIFTSEFTIPAIAHVIIQEGLTQFVVVILDPAKGKQKISIIDVFTFFMESYYYLPQTMNL
ncbi:hypothetical protein [Bacillus cereus]|uniref:hypothetical protein n=1 Tax=Bacillus cereus TaxID=1396 RepID=UPI0021C8001F|nr:hypothetical protein [Bacillus cereus]